MDPMKIGAFIKDIRKKENMSQQQFATKYGVTYQAVSKWENGKNIPDLTILQKICKDYNIDLNDLLDAGQKTPKKINFLYVILASIVIIAGILCIVICFKMEGKHPNFEFKTLSTTCEEFTLYGSIAYNDDKTSIYIPNVTYCGGDDVEKYEEIHCTLYENDGKTQKEIATYAGGNDKEVTLEEFLQNLNFNVDNYDKSCKTFKENSLSLVIEATTSSNKIITYKIPLSLEESCSN